MDVYFGLTHGGQSRRVVIIIAFLKRDQPGQYRFYGTLTTVVVGHVRQRRFNYYFSLVIDSLRFRVFKYSTRAPIRSIITRALHTDGAESTVLCWSISTIWLGWRDRRVRPETFAFRILPAPLRCREFRSFVFRRHVPRLRHYYAIQNTFESATECVVR